MTNYSIIQKSQLKGGLRLDSEFYHPEKLEAMEKLSKFGVSAIAENFKNVKETFNPLRHQLATTPARVFDLSDVSSFLLEEGKEVAGSDEVGSTKKIFRQNDVLISRLRPYLKEVSFVGFNDVQKLASTEFIVLRKKKDSKFPPQALFAFLITDEVQRILFWSQGGTEHPRFSENLLMNLKLPKLPENIAKSIAGDIDNAYENYLTSRNLYSQAEILLLEELGMKNFEIEDDLSYIVNLSEVKSARRADAEYFQPKYDKLVQVVAQKFNIKELKQIFSFKRGIFVSTKHYTEEKTHRPYIRIKELSGGKSGIDESKIIFIDERYPEDKNNILKENDLVIAIIGDTIGKVNRINKELANGFCSNNMGRLRIKPEWNSKIIPEFSEILFQSIFIQMQVERKKAQTGQPKIGDNEIKSIKIPILPKSTQQKFADLVQKSHEARSKAKQFLEQAKQNVEV